MSGARTLGVGVIGCGNISETYFKRAPLFRGIEMRACADIDKSAADRRALQFSVRPESVEGLLRSEDIDIVVNLTVPSVHHAVSAEALEAGKHVYSEKPFVLDVEQGEDLRRRAERRGLRVGSAPDTFLGGAHQLARKLIDDGRFGRITGGTCFVMSHGMEHWHPNPDFFFQPGAGPILDVGPYYIANLIQLIGPIARVAAVATTPARERTIKSMPRRGEKIPVNTPTTIHSLIEFANGAVVTLNASWDVWSHGHAPMELYGEDGSLFVPDPNFFGGTLRFTRGEKPVNRAVRWDHPFAIPNRKDASGDLADYRSVGLADMAQAILGGRPHRCSLEAALHAVDVMTAILASGETGSFVKVRTSCERPAALGPREARALLARPQRPAAM